MVGGVIWCVLSEIQRIKLCNTPTTSFQSELRTNLNRPIWGPIDIGLSPKLGEHHNMVGGVIWCVLSEIQWIKLCNAPTTPYENEVRTNQNCQI